MKQTTCTDCGAVYAANEHSCPSCGCPNDNYQPQQEENPKTEASKPEDAGQTVNTCGDDFNEGVCYSPFSSTSWFFRTPWPLKNYPERKMFDEAHPFLGWLVGPWNLTCKSKDEKEEYAVINNVFYFFNLIFKTWLYANLWTFFKVWPIVLLWLLLGLFSGGAAHGGSESAVVVVEFVVFMLSLFVYVILGIVGCCALGRALHRYWPSIHQTWRRINKRYWKAMHNQK